MTWNNYSHERPPKAGLYLIADTLRMTPYVAYFTKASGFTDQDDGPLDQWVTHWMDLPPMPADQPDGAA